MKRFFFILLALTASLLPQGKLADYKRAEKFLPQNFDKLVFSAYVRPNWIEKSARFWYRNNSRQGKEFLLVDAKKNSRRPAFNHMKLAQALSKAVNKKYTAYELPFDTFEFSEKGKAITFKVDKKNFKCDLKSYQCQVFEPEKENKSQSKSPDGKWIAFVKDHNLYVRPAKNGAEIQLSFDGSEKYAFATSLSWNELINESEPEKNKQEPQISVKWSPDCKKLVTFRLDRRKAKKLYLYQSNPEKGFRAVVHSYERALPGETELTEVEYFIFDIEKKRQTRIDIDTFPSFLSWDSPSWFKDSKRLYFIKVERGYHRVKVLEIDGESGKTRTIIEDKSPTYIEPQLMELRLLEKSSELIWACERDGWNHLYRYDLITGNLKNRITTGKFVVFSVVHVDEEKRRVYFVAGGREKGRDPYLRHLYRVDLDGTNLRLLTPEHADHDTRMSPGKDYFVDNYSRIDTPPVSVLRRTRDGKVLRTLEKGDIEKLLAAGWKWPEPFKVKARDGKTDIYGAIFRPTTFDPAGKYPVIDATYTGPQAVNTPKNFNRGARNSYLSLAELGFIVITIDGLGTAKRARAFHDVSYKNLGDIGAEDHIKGIKEMAARYPYMDIDRVGIFGHSAGGYDAAHALLTHPEFYKVAVSSAGNHDHRMAKVWWPELYMGHPVGSHYDEQSNLTLAKNLRGKLLLVHGDMDNNVNPAATLRLAAKLIEANKDFDLLIIPNKQHGLSDSAYFIRRRWDYFVRHLLGMEPPREYKITSLDEVRGER